MKILRKVMKLFGFKPFMRVIKDKNNGTNKYCFPLEEYYLSAKNTRTNECNVDLSYYYFLCSIKLREDIETWLHEQTITQYDLILNLKATLVTLNKSRSQTFYKTIAANAELSNSDNYNMAEVNIRFMNKEDALAFKMVWL